MKVFQTLHAYPPYIPFFEKKYEVDSLSYEAHRKLLLEDRFYALHILQPCLENTSEGFYTIWNYEKLQYKWAEEKGWHERDLKKILFAQIEEFKPDVFYTFSSDDFSKELLDEALDDRIIRICWSAAPGRNKEIFKSYKTRLTNLPEDVQPESLAGFRSDLFQPAFDPTMMDYAINEDRPIDLLFYGQYFVTGFDVRNKQLHELLAFKRDNPQLNIQLCLQYKIKEKIYINIPFIRRFFSKIEFPPAIVREQSNPPLYGKELYTALSKSKIVFNAGVDFSKNYKVNMRNFEVLGCGAHMISDQGIYPNGFEMGKHFSTYENMEDCLAKIKALLQNDAKRKAIAKEGHRMVQTQYSKKQQWETFQQIVKSL